MIESRIQNEVTLKRYRRFKKRKTAVLGFWVLLIFAFFSLTGEFWANSKPIILNYKGSTYFPVVKYYHPSVFGSEDAAITDYRKLPMEDGDWAVWPPIKWDPFETDSELPDALSPPSGSHWLGTDSSGRDVMARLLYGFRYTMGFALAVWLLESFLGIVIGAVMGFLGGKTDLIFQRIIEILESLPWLLLLLTVTSVFDAGLIFLIIFTASLGWFSTSQYVRGEFLKLRKREFVEAARALGASQKRTIFHHLLPNGLTPWITSSPFLISGLIQLIAILDYLGYGLPPPTPSWGELLNQVSKYISIAWWLALFPSLAIFISVYCMNLVGEGVRDAYDPRK